MFVFMGTNIMLWNCQGIRPKRKELEVYLNENNFDIVALNETFLIKKICFKIQGYDTIKNDRSAGARGGVAFLVKHGLVINKEYRNIDSNIITDNEALVIDIDLSNNQNLILDTIYCPNGNLNLRLLKPSTAFPAMSCLSAILIQIRSFRLCQEKHLWSNAQKYPRSSKFILFKY